MPSLAIRHKLIGIVALLLIPIALLAWLFVDQSRKDVTFAAKEADARKRYGILKQAETQLIETECVVAPVYHYVGVQFYQADFLGGVEANLIDEHPLRCMFWKQTPPRLQKSAGAASR